MDLSRTLARYQAAYPYILPSIWAVQQLNDPALLAVLLYAMIWAAGLLVVMVCVLFWVLSLIMPLLIAGMLGGLAGLAFAVTLFLPTAVLVAALLMEQVARVVEARFYPQLRPVPGASMGMRFFEGLVLAGLLTGLGIAAVLISWVLPTIIGLLFGWFLSAWALGRGLFMALALRRRERPEALALYRERRWAVLGYGGALAFCMSIPGVNLLATVLGVAMMLHLVEGSFAQPQGALYQGEDY